VASDDVAGCCCSRGLDGRQVLASNTKMKKKIFYFGRIYICVCKVYRYTCIC
jgi:hypothetical protein